MRELRPIMFVGTGSDVGKSVITTGFCRILLQDGFKPAPFKAQNMSLNSYVTPDGLEIGRAQAVQAEACGLQPLVEMNPVLLKPTGEMCSQVILHGKPVGNSSATGYFERGNCKALFREVMNSYNKLAREYNPVVIEGAGAVSEINLWDRDIVNMPVAWEVGAATFLVADIDRGGVFASVLGSMQLMPPDWRSLIKGVIINKFRGNADLFTKGREMIREISGVPVVGVIPWMEKLLVEHEDSVVLERLNRLPDKTKINIAVVKLPYMSNFTDFNALQMVGDVNLFFTLDESALQQADIIILPGSKNVPADMQFITSSGIATVIKLSHARGTPLFGVCGGYQIMGQRISDPHAVEGNIKEITGLGILPVETILETEKKTKQCRFSFASDCNISGEGYEIHMGRTSSALKSPLCFLDDGTPDGFYLDKNTWGTYIHGIFDNDSVIREVLKTVRPDIQPRLNYRQAKENGYNDLARVIRENSDIDYIYKCLAPGNG